MSAVHSAASALENLRLDDVMLTMCQILKCNHGISRAGLRPAALAISGAPRAHTAPL